MLNLTFAKLKKIGQKIIKIIKIKKSFRPPKKKKILVFDKFGLNNLKPLFDGEPFEVFHVRGENLNISPIILYRCLLHKIRERSLFNCYLLAYIDQVSPAIVITYIDNNSAFQQVDLKNRNNERKFIAIANGTRKFSGPQEILKMNGPLPEDIYHSNLFCQGQYCADQYLNNGATVKNLFPVGSLCESYFRALPRKDLIKPTFDICLIVTPLYDTPYYTKLHGDGRQCFEVFLGYLRVFSERNDVKISMTSIHPADTEESKNEIKWLKRFLGDCCTYFPQKNGVPSSSYFVSNDAEVVIGYASTLLRECFGRGKKVLQINYSDLPFHDFPYDGIWLLKKSGYPLFEKSLLDLLLMNQDDYKKQCKHYPSYLIGYNEAKPTHIAISEFIKQHIQIQDEKHNSVSSNI
jgi:surface carbohydrate biosynthesis protein